jgi:hypothetical protein
LHVGSSFRYLSQRAQAKADAFTASCGDGQPPEKCAPKECANEPKPPRDTWLDPESDEVVVLADELPEEDPPEKKP